MTFLKIVSGIFSAAVKTLTLLSLIKAYANSTVPLLFSLAQYERGKRVSIQSRGIEEESEYFA